MRQIRLVFLLISVSALLTTSLISAWAGTNTLISGSTQSPANYSNIFSCVSGDGQVVTFASNASNLGNNGSNGDFQVFVTLPSGEMELVSVAYDGNSLGNSDSFSNSINRDGNFVTFESVGTNLVSGVGNDITDQIFLRDRVNQTTSLVSVAADGSTPGDDNSYGSSVSADGRYVAFVSSASNLVTLQDAAVGYYQVYMRDMNSGVTRIVSVASNGTHGDSNSHDPSISASGRYVAFTSDADNLVPGVAGPGQVYVYDTLTNTTELVSISKDAFSQGNSASGYPSINADGRFVAFLSYADDLTSNTAQYSTGELYLRDRLTQTTQIISVASDGVTQANAQISVRAPYLSSDGQVVTFVSMATNLASGAIGISEVYVRDRLSGNTSIASMSYVGSTPSDSACDPGSISANGRFIAFDSFGTNLVNDVTSGNQEIYLRDQGANKILLAGIADDGSIWYTKDLQTWFSVPGTMSSLIVGDFNGSRQDGIAAIAPDKSIWYTSDLQTWTNISGSLQSIIAADFNGDGSDDIAGIAPDGSIWYTTDLSTWNNVPGNLIGLQSGIFNTSGNAGVAGVATDNSVWYSSDMGSWLNVPGFLSTFAVGDFKGNWKAGIGGVAVDGSTWFSDDLATWQYIPGVLQSLVAGDFNESGISGIAGIASDNSIWYTTDMATWTNIPGYLSSMVAEDLNGDGKCDIAGIAPDNSIWYTTDMQTWTNIPGRLQTMCSGRTLPISVPPAIEIQ